MHKKKKENLIAINEWCKSVHIKDQIIYVDNALYYNHRYYKLSISNLGMRLYGNGKYSQWMHIDERSNSLIYQNVGNEIIYNWYTIKAKILEAIRDYERKQDIMENFTV